MARTPLLRSVDKLLVAATEANRRQWSNLQLFDHLRLTRERRFSRRGLLKFGAGSAALVGLAACKTAGGESNVLAEEGRGGRDAGDVVVLGAGIAGLTAAYRLNQAGIRAKIYEARDRVGGRILTKDRFNQDGMFCELGAELVDSAHEVLRGLAGELGVEVQEFGPFDAGVVDALYFFGGKIRTGAEMLPDFRPFAQVIDEDRLSMMKDGQVQIPTYNNPLGSEKWDRMSLEEYLESKRGKGIEDWVLDMIGVAYTGEYGLLPGQQSALNLLTLVGTDTTDFSMFGISDESKRIKGGNSRIIEALHGAIKDKVQVELGQQLVAIADSGPKLRLTFKTGAGTVEVLADRVVCTLPFTLLRQVEGLDTLGLSPRKMQAIQELGYGTLSKFMVGFKSRYWRKDHGAVKASTGSLYTDTRSRQFWESSRAQAGDRGIITNFLSDAEGKNVAPNQLALSLQDLEKIWPGISRQTDGNKILQAWPADRWAQAAYTCQTVGQYTTLHGAAQEPEMGGRLYFAGEHCSIDWQGYMEGGAQTGQLAARALLAQAGATRGSYSRRIRRR